ncbi:MAG: S41 family peptidase [Oscillospiraceae bacterium]|nr:S41 family peptidase [Oscillospiraceae bacterium]
MNKKFSLGVCISLIAIACAVTFVLTMNLSLNIYNEKVAGVEQREAIYTKLQDIDSYVRNNFLGSIDEEKLVAGIMNGYMAGIGDNKAKYITAAEYRELEQRISGRIVTAGIEAVRDESGYIIIKEVYEGSSAMLQGIEADDIITQIDGVQVLEIGAEEAIRRLNGEEGTRLIIRTQRDGESRRVTLFRQSIELITVKGVNYEELGYIRISGFAENTGDQFEAVLSRIIENEAKGLIIDVRGTDGCLIAPLKQIFDKLLPRGVAAVGEYKNGNVNNIIEIGDDSYIHLPITVITDSGTAENGELLAAVLGDLASAQIVGVNTKGDAVFTVTHTLRDKSALILSLMRVRSAGGTSFDGEGIKPDFIVEAATPPETNLEALEITLDTQIRKAIEVTETRINNNNN